MIEQFTEKKIDIPRREVYRYLGCGTTPPDDQTQALVEKCIEEFQTAALYRACRLRCGITMEGQTIHFGTFSVKSGNLSRNLQGCSEVLLFAATVGIRADQLISRSRQTSPARAVILDSVGSAAVEAWCNQLCKQWGEELLAENRYLRPRFSPGYGDFPLDTQRPLLQTLDAFRKAGISLTETTIMVPRKSVSAVIGLGLDGCRNLPHDCEFCNLKNCAFRR